MTQSIAPHSFLQTLFYPKPFEISIYENDKTFLHRRTEQLLHDFHAETITLNNLFRIVQSGGYFEQNQVGHSSQTTLPQTKYFIACSWRLRVLGTPPSPTSELRSD